MDDKLKKKKRKKKKKKVKENLGKNNAERMLEEKLGENRRISLGEEFVECSRIGNVERMSELLKEDVDVNYRSSNGWCAVHWAARNANMKILQFLQSCGADLTKPDRPDAWTALHIAVKFENMNVIAWLVENGLNIRQKTRNQMTPLRKLTSSTVMNI